MNKPDNAHSYTEAASCDERPPYGKNPAKSTTCNSTANALRELLKLHLREADGDETITMKEWNRAIRNGEKALEQ